MGGWGCIFDHAYLSLGRPHDVLRVKGQQRLVILVLCLVVRGPSQQLPELLAVPVGPTKRYIERAAQ